MGLGDEFAAAGSIETLNVLDNPNRRQMAEHK